MAALFPRILAIAKATAQIFCARNTARKKTVLLLEGEAKPISELLVRAGVERRHLGEALFPSPRAIMSPKSAKVSFFGDLWLSANPRQRHPKTATLQPFWSKTAERNSQCEATTCAGKGWPAGHYVYVAITYTYASLYVSSYLYSIASERLISYM